MSRILLADDSPHARRMGERILREEGYEVFTVTDGNAALTRLAELDPDVIFADVSLPNRSGYEVCQKVKTHPRFSHVRVVLTAGLLEPFDEAQAAEVRCDGILKKPFESSVVIETVRPLAAAATRGRSAPAQTSSVMNEPPLVATLRTAPPVLVVPPPPPMQVAELEREIPERTHAKADLDVADPPLNHGGDGTPSRETTQNEVSPSRVRIEPAREVIVLSTPAAVEAKALPAHTDLEVLGGVAAVGPPDEPSRNPRETELDIPPNIESNMRPDIEANTTVVEAPLLVNHVSAGAPNEPQVQREELTREDRTERLRAAVTLAVNAALPAVVDQITEKILLALGD